MMHEILVVTACHYEQGAELKWAEEMLKSQNWPHHLWWFADGTSVAGLKDVILPEEGNVEHMRCEAIKFSFEFVPNHEIWFERSLLQMDYEGAGVDPFEQFLPQFVEIAQRQMAEDRNWPPPGYANFYVLFEVDYDAYCDEDGGLDEVHVNPTFLGELDFDKLPLALKGANNASK